MNANRFTIATRTLGKRADARLEFVASTETDEATDGLVLLAEDWDLERFVATGGPIAWSHDYAIPLIARATDVGVKNRELRVVVEFDRKDAFAAEIERKYRDGFLSAVSVGWFSRRENARTRNILLEVSCVSIPSDPSALLAARAAVAKGRPQTGAEVVEAIDKALRGAKIDHDLKELARLLAKAEAGQR